MALEDFKAISESACASYERYARSGLIPGRNSCSLPCSRSGVSD